MDKLHTSQIKIISFNCCGVSSKLPVIKELCDNNDIVVLQETWLLPHNISILESVHEEFSAHSTSAVDCTEALVGKPFGGISILWRNSIGRDIKIVSHEDKRMMGIEISIDDRTLYVLNVYLPYFSHDNYDLYLEYVGKISSMLELNENSDIIVIGDFNANINGEFYQEWVKVCHEYDMVFADVDLLPENTVTHVNNSSLTASWLDHVLTSQPVYDAITAISVQDNFYCSDHFPVKVVLNFSHLPAYSRQNSTSNRSKVKWKFENSNQRSLFYDILVDCLGQHGPLENHYCQSHYCNNASHVNHIDAVYDAFVNTVINAGITAFGSVRSSNKHNGRSVPGWNDYVKDTHEFSRGAFLSWRHAGSPRFGPIAQHMRNARAHFKLALRNCKRNENNIRAKKSG